MFGLLRSYLKKVLLSLPLLKSRNEGVVLIEFAVCMPVFILILQLMLDHYRFYELKSKIRSAAYLAASMVQNISNCRESQKLTQADFKNICRACSLVIANKENWGNSLFALKMQVNYLKKSSSTENKGYKFCVSTTRCSGSSFGEYEPADTTDITIDNVGDEIVKIRAFLYPASGSSGGSFKQMNFQLMSPEVKGNENAKNPFEYTVTFTPKPGIMDLTHPTAS